MSTSLIVLCVVAIALLAASAHDADAAATPLDADRVDQIASMLPETPAGLGRPITDREAWTALAQIDAFADLVPRAEALLDRPLPEQPDELYLDFSRTGNRTRWQNVSRERRGRLAPLVLAECMEDRGRFIPAIEELVAALCAERTWVMPAHDRSLANFNGEQIDIDLASSALGWHLATAYRLLGDRLSDGPRGLIADNVRERILEPYRAMYTGERDLNWWMVKTNNWNAVCLAGVTGAGLAQLQDRRLRAELIAAAEMYSRNFLNGFTADGYCSEGLGYWNYGFGNYVLLAETVRQATGGGVDLMDRPGVAAPATFGARIQIIGGVAPAFADCSIAARPDQSTMYYLNRRYRMGLSEYDEVDLRPTTGSLSEALIFAFPNSASEGAVLEGAGVGEELRTWFDEAGVLISRPAPGSECRLGVALKGGHNAEHHNHNDVGSYVAVVEDRAVLLDPGSEVYTGRTFSGRRYESKLLNSWGHPVPVIAGQLQRTGADARAEVRATDFTDERDAMTLDLSAAYDVPELERLERAFVYDRTGNGRLTVTDTVELAEPREFETALITDGDWQRRDDGALVIWDVDRAVEVTIDTAGAAWELVVDEIHEDAAAQPTRLAVRLAEPVTSATVTVTVTPAPELGRREGSLLLNGDFAFGSYGWSLPGNSQGEVSDEMAAAGERSLKITDESDTQGSNVTSARMAVEGVGRWVLSGRVHHVSGEGIGMYVRFYDGAGNRLNETDERGWISPVGSLTGEAGTWQPFEFEFETPEATTSMDLWIHSYSSARVVAYLDDLRIAAAE